MGRAQKAEARSIGDRALTRVPDTPRSAEPAGTLHVEQIDAATLERCESAWSDLVGRAVEPNIFLEPGFALPLLRHGGLSRRMRFLMVWEESGPTAFGRLLGLLPFVAPAGAMRLVGIAEGWAHNQVCSGVPLVDRDRFAEVLEALFGRLRSVGANTALALRLIPKDGAFFAEIARCCETAGGGFSIVEEHPRAFLKRSYAGDERVASFVSVKRRKEHARLSRRLSALGMRSYSSAVTPADVAGATERFLELEHAGWKGARGTSFLAKPMLASFLRDLTQDLAQQGKCRVDAIEIDGRPIAMGIVLATEDRAYFWKTAFDESHASLSPGVQFTLDLTQRQLTDPSILSTDSCAVADHPMIDRLWPDRLVVCDLMIGVRRDDDRRFRRSLQIDRLRRDLRRRAKAALYRLRRLRHG